MSLPMSNTGLDISSSTGLTHVNTLTSSLRQKGATGFALYRKHKREYKRIGVPGHRHYDYMNNIEAWLEYAGSTWQQVIHWEW